jgi:hypothetical protein
LGQLHHTIVWPQPQTLEQSNNHLRNELLNSRLLLYLQVRVRKVKRIHIVVVCKELAEYSKS